MEAAQVFTHMAGCASAGECGRVTFCWVSKMRAAFAALKDLRLRGPRGRGSRLKIFAACETWNARFLLS